VAAQRQTLTRSFVHTERCFLFACCFVKPLSTQLKLLKVQRRVTARKEAVPSLCHLEENKTMVMTRQSYRNTRDTIIVPNDPLDMDLILVDYQGFPISLVDGSEIKDVRFTVSSMIGGWWASVTNLGSPTYNPQAQMEVIVGDAEKGHLTIKVLGDVLNILRGYLYRVEVKSKADPDTSYKTMATGRIELLNQ
jgi:hypothetical protein